MQNHSFASLLALFTLLAFISVTTSGCPVSVEDDLATIDCPPFDNAKLAYFPYEQGDVLTFISTDTSANAEDRRRISLFDVLVYGDTSFQSVFPDAVCSPYADFIGNEQDNDTTAFNFRITDLVNTSPTGTQIAFSLADNGLTSLYTMQILITANGELASGRNTAVSNLGTKVINGISYDDVIEMRLVEAPEFTDRFVNDVRNVWISRSSGIIRFYDNARGSFVLQQ